VGKRISLFVKLFIYDCTESTQLCTLEDKCALSHVPTTRCMLSIGINLLNKPTFKITKDGARFQTSILFPIWFVNLMSVFLGMRYQRKFHDLALDADVRFRDKSRRKRLNLLSITSDPNDLEDGQVDALVALDKSERRILNI